MCLNKMLEGDRPRRGYLLNAALIILFMSYYFLPKVMWSINFMVPVMAGVLYIIFTLNFYGTEFKETATYLGLVFWIALLYFMLVDSGNYIKFLSRFHQVFMCFFPLYIFYTLVKRNNRREMILIFLAMTLMYCYVFALTLNELRVNPLACRDWFDAQELSNRNVGGYFYVYTAMALLPFMMYCRSKANKFLIKLLFLGMIVITFYFLIQAQYTLSLLIAVIVILIGITLNIKDRRVRIVLLTFVPIGVIIIPIVLNFAAANVESKQVALRLTELANFLSSGDSSGYNLSGRFMLYWSAFKAFLSSPILGNKFLGFDAHSSFLAVMARTGIGGAVAYFYLHIHSKKLVVKMLGSEKETVSYVPAYYALCILGWTNPIISAYLLNAVVWLYIPLGMYIISHHSKKALGTDSG